jgi:hypothetical protein
MAKRKFTEAEIISALEMAETVYRDACAQCIPDVADSRDLQTIRSRCQGPRAVVLDDYAADFCKDFERSLEVGYIDSTCFRAFRKHGTLPSFLKSMTSLIFDRETGKIHDGKNNPFASDVPTIINAVRQICLAFEKIEPGRATEL